MTRLALLAGLAACWHGAAAAPDVPASSPPPPPRAACGEVAERWLAVRFARDYPHADPAMQDAFVDGRERFAEHCGSRAWDAEVRRCVVFAAQRWELDACLSRLPHRDRRVISHLEIDLLTKLRDALDE